MTVPINAEQYFKAIEEVASELVRAREKHDPMHSAHEGWAVILEELDELWEQVRLRREKRDRSAMRVEAKQIAAMAIAFMVEVAGEDPT